MSRISEPSSDIEERELEAPYTTLNFNDIMDQASRYRSSSDHSVDMDRDSQSQDHHAPDDWVRRLRYTYEDMNSISISDYFRRWLVNEHYRRQIKSTTDFTQTAHLKQAISNKPAMPSLDTDALDWSAESLATAILDPQAEEDMPRLRELILLAETAQFTGTFRYQLAEWLLSFAERQRDSDDPQDAAAVWSAIRRGSALLESERVNRLQDLLEPGHAIETSAVTLKMLGRIFAAQPPNDVDCYPKLSDQVNDMAAILLKDYVLVDDEPAARATLAVYALAAMASSHLEERIHTIRALKFDWFRGIVRADLEILLQEWRKPEREIAHSVCDLVDGARRILDSQ